MICMILYDTLIYPGSPAKIDYIRVYNRIIHNTRASPVDYSLLVSHTTTTGKKRFFNARQKTWNSTAPRRLQQPPFFPFLPVLPFLPASLPGPSSFPPFSLLIPSHHLYYHHHHGDHHHHYYHHHHHHHIITGLCQCALPLQSIRLSLARLLPRRDHVSLRPSRLPRTN